MKITTSAHRDGLTFDVRGLGSLNDELAPVQLLEGLQRAIAEALPGAAVPSCPSEGVPAEPVTRAPTPPPEHTTAAPVAEPDELSERTVGLLYRALDRSDDSYEQIAARFGVDAAQVAELDGRAAS